MSNTVISVFVVIRNQFLKLHFSHGDRAIVRVLLHPHLQQPNVQILLYGQQAGEDHKVKLFSNNSNLYIFISWKIDFPGPTTRRRGGRRRRPRRSSSSTRSRGGSDKKTNPVQFFITHIWDNVKHFFVIDSFWKYRKFGALNVCIRRYSIRQIMW